MVKTLLRQDIVSHDPMEISGGRSKGWVILWFLLKITFIRNSLPWSGRLKCTLLRFFGSKVGVNLLLKPNVNVHLPWMLEIGDHTWIGEEVFILNFRKVVIGSHCCISQRAFLCTGNHDFRDPSMPFRNAPITIKDGVWVGAQSFVAPGVTIGTDCVITAGSVVLEDMPDNMICSGNPCRPIKPRWK